MKILASDYDGTLFRQDRIAKSWSQKRILRQLHVFARPVICLVSLPDAAWSLYKRRSSVMDLRMILS